MNENVNIHELADVQSVSIGEKTSVWQFSVVLPKARIGKETTVCAHCFIENDVEIGDRCTIKSHVSIWDGLRIKNDVYIGPNVTFNNDLYPRSKKQPKEILNITIDEGASIGGGSVIFPGVTIGKGAMVVAGTVITNSVPPYAIVKGYPAIITGYVSNDDHSSEYRDASFTQQSGQKISMLEIGQSSVHLFNNVEDIRGNLVVGEFPDEVPFIPKRYFTVYDVPSREVRGEHAHKECHQFLICVKGSCSALVDDGINRKQVDLNEPNIGLYIPPMLWGTQFNYSHDAVLLVFASHRYDPDDYIREYTDFIKLKNL